MVLADSCRSFNLATPSSSVSYRECVWNYACQEGRKSWLSLIGFRKFICACPCYMAMRVSLWTVPVVDVCLKMSLFCGCPRYRCEIRPVFTSFCRICLSVFAPSLEYLDIILCLWHEFFCLHRISENRRKLGLPKEKLIRVLPTGRTYKIK